ncbi:MAG: flavodoxin [Thomasclavelia sp.]|jgi:flavodoxin|nr:flavodoxin [Thomasclavelia sp.]
MNKMLVVYFSFSNGNTKKIATLLAEAKKANLEEIKPITPYLGTYDEVVTQGQKEVNEGFKPPIKKININDYQVIAIGTPTWWFTMAPAVKTFIEENDFTDKTVIPFMTNGGWPGHVIKDMTNSLKGATVINPMEIRFDSNGGDKLITDSKLIEKWIDSIDIKE